MKRVIRIGTRDSELALWQANTVKRALEELGLDVELVPVKSEGDLSTELPLYELGITGIFTRTLDIALLKKQVDIAVHSLKDVPTAMPQGIMAAAILERANPCDMLVHKGLDFLNTEGIVATGSLRRKAQWLHRYPSHEIVDLRGNVPTRLRKLNDESWNAAIFAVAGLERLGHTPEDAVELQWMVPAPAQGSIVIAALEEDNELREVLRKLNHGPTEHCNRIEREFLRTLEGGCSAPIGALAQISGDRVQFKGVLATPDGRQLLHLEEETEVGASEGFGEACAKRILNDGGEVVMKSIHDKRKG